jgi:hypothetical protein
MGGGRGVGGGAVDIHTCKHMCAHMDEREEMSVLSALIERDSTKGIIYVGIFYGF